VDTLEIKIDELSKWKQALEVDLKELSKELDKVQEKIIRQAIRFEIFKGIENKQNVAEELYENLKKINIEKETLEKETFKKQEEIWTLITMINIRLTAFGVVI